MSSTGPNRASGYRYPPAPAPAIWDRETADALHGDIHVRLVALEAKGTELDDLLSDLSFTAQTRVDETITPIVTAVRSELADLRLDVAAAVQAAADAADDVSAAVEARIATLEQRVTDAEAKYAQIIAGQVPAGSVTESAARVFVTPDQKAEISKLRTDRNTDVAATSARFDELVYYGGIA